MIDLTPELHARVRDIFARLAVLSDAPTSQVNLAVPAAKPTAQMEPGKCWDDYTLPSHPYAESREPPGFRDGRRGRPHPDFDSLTDWFADRIGRARSELAARRLCTLAEAKIDRATGRTKAPFALAANAETSKQRDKRIATDPDYLGEPPEVVAEAESEGGHVSAANVRRVRVTWDPPLDPETGYELPPERRLKEKRAKVKRAEQLHADGMPIRQIAIRFDVSASTVLGWLGRRGQEAA